VEVEKFDKGEDELETDLDKWLYLLKNMSNLLERPERLRDRIFTKLFDVAELAQLDDKDRTNYIKSMNTERDTYNQIEYARETGREEVGARVWQVVDAPIFEVTVTSESKDIDIPFRELEKEDYSSSKVYRSSPF
jgi:hypothetical protein